VVHLGTWWKRLRWWYSRRLPDRSFGLAFYTHSIGVVQLPSLHVPAMTDPVRLSRKAVSQFAAKRQPGYESALMSTAVTSDEQSVTITRADYDRLRDEFALLCGPGCQLRRTLAWWGIHSDGSCGCDSFAAQMDAWGPDECWRRLEEIVEHLRTAAAEKGLPFIGTAARIMVGRAIEAARKEVAHATQAEAEALADVARP
jgi:hypothetical protein